LAQEGWGEFFLVGVAWRLNDDQTPASGRSR
jgi:hypothetical protein